MHIPQQNTKQPLFIILSNSSSSSSLDFHPKTMPVAESVKPTGSSSSEGEKQKHINREVRDMVSAITSRLTNIHKVGSGQGQEEGDDDDNDVKIITLAGTNMGANLRGELDEKTSGDKPVVEDSDALRTYVNSNFQAVNNSIMMGGSYKTNDPGVHVEISDFVDPKDFKSEQRLGWGKGKKKEKDSKSGEPSTSSGSDSSSD